MHPVLTQANVIMHDHGSFELKRANSSIRKKPVALTATTKTKTTKKIPIKIPDQTTLIK